MDSASSDLNRLLEAADGTGSLDLGAPPGSGTISQTPDREAPIARRPPKLAFVQEKPESCDEALSVPSGRMMEDDMTSVAIDVPLMYADHHVVEVRRILFEVPGVETVDASSAFQVVKIGYDPDKTSEDVLKQILDENGYLGDLQVPLESGKPAVGSDGETYFRHSAAYETAGTVISFGQEITASGRPLWPCPGMGAPPTTDE
jgi:copper chaperone CopZ